MRMFEATSTKVEFGVQSRGTTPLLRGPRSDRRAGLVWEPLVRGIRMSD